MDAVAKAATMAVTVATITETMTMVTMALVAMEAVAMDAAAVCVCVTRLPVQLVLPIKDLSRSGGVLQLHLSACY